MQRESNEIVTTLVYNNKDSLRIQYVARTFGHSQSFGLRINIFKILTDNATILLPTV